MPFTPFHMGAGLAVKALAGRRFSVLSFGIAQVAMDIEPLIGIIRDADVLHGPTHTYFGALVIALLVIPIARPLAAWILIRWNRTLRTWRLDGFTSPESIDWPAVASGALIGTLSHVALDSVMHADMHPLAPFAMTNTLLGWISIGALHLWCVVAGMFGVAAWIVAALIRTRRARSMR